MPRAQNVFLATRAERPPFSQRNKDDNNCSQVDELALTRAQERSATAPNHLRWSCEQGGCTFVRRGALAVASNGSPVAAAQQFRKRVVGELRACLWRPTQWRP